MDHSGFDIDRRICHSAASDHKMARKKNSALVSVIEEALPDRLVSRARRAIARLGNERMRESYFTTFWLDKRAWPANVIEEAVLWLWKNHARVPDCAGMEWWIGRAYADRLPIEFHFDHDIKGRARRHPILSSVVFFNSVSGGQLAVTDQTPGVVEAERLETVKPRRNRYAMFAGNRFHGVLGG